MVIAAGEHLYAVRDPMGIKPLYVAVDNDLLLFASELKAFPSSVSRAQEFPAGTWFHSETGFQPYYELPESGPNPQRQADPDVLALAVRATIEDAVQKRLMSDVPVGAFLSGGLDSSIVTAIARQHVSELHTFSVGFPESDDLEGARYLSRILDTVHHEYVLNEDEILAKLPEILYHLESFDLDLVRSAIPCYFTARLASHYVKVILTGEGADELFAGCAYYKDYTNRAKTLQDELRRSVGSMHNINLQRVDRMTMAHSVEGRVPFLDLSVIELAFRIPAELKLYPAPAPKATEKWILRKACEDLLPARFSGVGRLSSTRAAASSREWARSCADSSLTWSPPLRPATARNRSTSTSSCASSRTRTCLRATYADGPMRVADCEPGRLPWVWRRQSPLGTDREERLRYTG